MCSRKTSEPIPIPSRYTSDDHTSDYPRNIQNIENIGHRLKNAALFAKSELSSSPKIQSAIVITGHLSSSIVITELKKNGEVYIVVYKNIGGTSSTLFKEKKDRWRFIFLKGIYDSRIFVNCKLLKIMFEECEGCIISLKQPIIGSCEFLRCENINLNIRIHRGTVDNGSHEITTGDEFAVGEYIPIPYIRIELCKSISITQNEMCTLIYIINTSYGVSGTIVEESGLRCIIHDERELGGKLFWNEQEQTIISFSKKEGFASVPFYYALNDVSNHIILKPLESVEGSEIDIGSTPPVSKSFK